MYLSDVKNKIDCCFAKSVYTKYLQKRYGIEGCKEQEIDELDILQKTFSFYKEAYFTIDRDVNTAKDICPVGECNLTKLIEKIATL